MNTELLKICHKIRNKKISINKTIDGACREVSLAIAIEALRSGINICFCVGTYGPEQEGHHWLRCEGKIYDATVSQFGVKEDVLVIEENMAKNFKEENFVYICADSVTELLTT